MIEISTIPQSPGIYLMKDAEGTILYVGKAKNLKRRVTSYFNREQMPKIERLLQRITDIDVIITQNDTEAYILENQYIKKCYPRYNTRLKDSKTYPYLKIELDDDYPRVIKTRIREKDNALYFGPYVSHVQVNHLLDIIRDHFGLRRCKNYHKKKVPCLYYHIGSCTAPCIKAISYEQYKDKVKEITLLLEGRYNRLILILEERMRQSSREQNYEEAVKYRDQIEAIRMLKEKQSMENIDSKKNIDFFGMLSYDDQSIFQVFRVKEGCLIQNFSFDVENDFVLDREELIKNCVNRFYTLYTDYPNEIVLDVPVEDESFIQYYKSQKVRVVIARESYHQTIMEMLKHNAYFTLKRKLEIKNEISYADVARRLKKELDLKKTPNSVIGIDISHLGGTNIVGAMVYFKNGLPVKDNYRKYNIRTVEDSDDYASIREVVSRFFRSTPLGQRPDLVLIDGGISQLNAALSALDELKIKDRDILSLAKKEETLYLPKFKDGVKLEKRHPGLQFLQQVRDEAHRFAISFQRTKRKKVLH